VPITPRPAGSRLVGRAAERAWLGDLLARAEAGEPVVAVVGGEAGVGKTTLVERFAADAAAGGAGVFAGACVPLGQEGLPLAPITAVLRDLVEQIGAERLLELLPGVAAGLLPELRDATVGMEPPSQGHLFQLLVALLEQLSRRQPIVVIIEDLHWADRSSCELLGVWARSLRRARVLVVTTCRTDELRRDDPLRAFLAELERLRSVHRTQLEPLSRAEITELVEVALARQLQPGERDRIYRRCGGNPLFAEELGQVATDGGDVVPGALRELLLARLSRLPAAARQATAAAAVGDDPVGHRLLVSAAGIPEDQLLEGLRAAVDGHVLTAVGGGYSFRHALIREVVYADLLPGERMRLHRRFAEALQARPELVGPERLASAQAHHWRLAHEPAKALPALLRAASGAAAVAAWTEQHHLLTRALQLWPEVDEPGMDRLRILEPAITAAHRAGEQRQALVLLEQALAEADRSREPERVAVLLANRSELLLNLSRGGALEVAQDAVRVAPVGSAAHAQGLNVLGAALGAQGRLVEAADAAGRAVAIAAELGKPELLIPARISYGLKLSRLDRHDEALAELRAAKALGEGGRDPRGLTRVHVNLAFLLWESGRYAEAADIARSGIAAADAAGLARTLGSHAAGLGAAALFAMGDWEEADALLARSLDADPIEVFAIYPRLLAAELAAARGQLGTATGQLALAQQLTDQYGVTQGALLAARVTAEVALQEARIADARRALRGVLDSTDRTDRTTLWWSLLNTAVQVEAHVRAHAHAFHTGAEAADGDELAALRAVAARLPATTPAWRAHAAQFGAEVASLDGPSHAWHGVVEAWDRLAAPHPAAYARLRAAEAVLAAGDRAGGRALLQAASDAAGRLGARPLLRDTELLARRAGVTLTYANDDSDTHSDTEDGAGPASPAVDRLKLTPRETEVLRLVAGGLTNRKIATELYITEKTASVHVSRILNKLGAANRGEAAALAHKLHLFDDGSAGSSERLR
jgi:DNA-binding CsgD family transcriptional regulator/tetratricopeptide (TPR) repeat protein